MENEEKTKEVSIEELEQSRQGIAGFEKSKARHRQTGEAVRESGECLQRLFETMDEGVVLTAPDGQIVRANPAAERILGLTHLEIEGRNYVGPEWEVIRVDGTPMPPEERAGPRAIKEKRPVKDQVMGVKRPNGATSWISISATLLIDEAGKLEGVVGTFTDITERKRADELLRETEERFRKIFEEGPLGMALVGLDGRLVKINPILCRMLGYTEEELSELTLDDVTHPEDLERGSYSTEKIFKDGFPYYRTEKRCIRKDGEILWVDLTASVIREEGGEPLYGLAMIAEITERKDAEGRLLRYQTQLRSLASELSLAEERVRRRIAVDLHDRIGQNLALVKMKLGCVKESIDSVGRSRDLNEICGLIEQTIHDTRSLTLELSPPVLYELGFEAAVEWLTEEVQKEHGIAIDFEKSGQTHLLDEDIRVLLFQAVRELLVNVARHAQAQRVKVSVQRDNTDIRISVKDDGIGFDVSKTGFQVDRNGGFGLFNIRERLEHIGGYFGIESEPGTGTTITVIAPLRREGETAKREGA